MMKCECRFLLLVAITVVAQGSTLSAGEFDAKILPYDGGALDWFGSSLALDGDTLVIGSEWHSHGGQVGLARGSAYVYKNGQSGWQLVAELFPDDGQPAANFGNHVAISGSTIVVGDYQHGLASKDGTIGLAGAAYVFEESDLGWNQTAKLIADDPIHQQYFGTGVGIDNGTIIVSDRHASAYVFEKKSGSWGLTQKLSPSVTDGFGLSGSYGQDVAIEGDTALIAAYSQDAPLTNRGAVFAYARTASGWKETQVIVPDNPSRRGSFGISIGLSGDTAIIGRSAGEGSTSNPLPGAAYIYEQVGGVWIQKSVLTPGYGHINDQFGAQVAISGNLAAVSASGRDVTTVYLFKEFDGLWGEVARFTTGVKFTEDQFGVDLALYDKTLAIGARIDDQLGRNAGAVYLVRIPEPSGMALMASWLAGTVCRTRRRGTVTTIRAN